MIHSSTFRSLSFLAVMTLQSSSASGQVDCKALTSVTLPETQVVLAQLVLPSPATSASLPGLASAPATAQYCKVRVVATPTKDSEIGVEVWMPMAEWNGELLQVGNGGLAGSINETSMAQGVARHFAVAGTDNGHKGTGTDGSWAVGHPERVIDFGYRAVHITSVLSRLLVQEFYGRSQKYAFFNGCSEGGREALMEAQRFPGDFNGILAGAPAADWTGLMTGFAWNAQAVLGDPKGYLQQEQRELVEGAVIKACGVQGGVSDPFVKDPLSCKFDPRTLLCKGSSSTTCLTGPQLTTLLKVYAGASEPASHKQLYPGYEPGPEAEGGTPRISYGSYIYGYDQALTLDLVFSSAFYGGAVAGALDYSSMAFDFSKDVSTMKKKVGAALDATATDLHAFKAQGGKLLQYHGWYDGSPAPRSSVTYYKRRDA